MALTAYSVEMNDEWKIFFFEDFKPEYAALEREVKLEFLAQLAVLRQFGPATGRPLVDTLSGSTFKNMKEFRIQVADAVWRFAFAFDPTQRAVFLCGGSKTGKSENRFYRMLITRADARYGERLRDIEHDQKAHSAGRDHGRAPPRGPGAGRSKRKGTGPG